MAKFPNTVNFSDRATYERIRDYLENEVFVFDYHTEALNYVRNIERYFHDHPDFINTYRDLAGKYEQLARKARFICLPALSDKEIVSLVRSSFCLSFELPDYELWPKLAAKIISFIQFNDRAVFKRQLREALLDNKEDITSQSITDSQLREPTAGNWLRDYIKTVDSNETNRMVVADYLSKRRAFQQLAEDERRKVKTLIELFENLKKSSLDPEGLEEAITVITTDGVKSVEKGVFSKSLDLKKDEWNRYARIANFNRAPTPAADGKMAITKAGGSTIGAKSALVAPILSDSGSKTQHLGVENLLKIYSQNPEEQKAIYDEEKKILARVGHGELNIRPEFEEAVRGNNRNRVIAFLNVLAKTQDLLTIIKTDSAYRAFLKDKYGPESIAQFDVQPADPIFYSLWLQYLLKQRLQMLESDSARVGTKLANLLGRKYLKVAYIDSTTGQFKWVPVKKEKNRLVLVQ